jgi:hypothetical protein
VKVTAAAKYGRTRMEGSPDTDWVNALPKT